MWLSVLVKMQWCKEEPVLVFDLDCWRVTRKQIILQSNSFMGKIQCNEEEQALVFDLEQTLVFDLEWIFFIIITSFVMWGRLLAFNVRIKL